MHDYVVEKGKIGKEVCGRRNEQGHVLILCKTEKSGSGKRENVGGVELM